MIPPRVNHVPERCQRCPRSVHIFNEDSGLYTVRFRTYSPTLGRWLERDPAGYVDGMGLYEYVRGGPIAAVDPRGLQAGLVDAEAVVGGGGECPPPSCTEANRNWQSRCDKLREKLEGHRREVEDRIRDFERNWKDLPLAHPDDYRRPRESITGHVRLLHYHAAMVRATEVFLEFWCNGPKPPPGFKPSLKPVPQPWPQPVLISPIAPNNDVRTIPDRRTPHPMLHPQGPSLIRPLDWGLCMRMRQRGARWGLIGGGVGAGSGFVVGGGGGLLVGAGGGTVVCPGIGTVGGAAVGAGAGATKGTVVGGGIGTAVGFGCGAVWEYFYGEQ